MQGEQRLYSIHVAHPLLSEPREFAMRPSSVFIFDAWHADERARLSVASPPGLERPQQALGIDPVGFDATGSPVDFQNSLDP